MFIRSKEIKDKFFSELNTKTEKWKQFKVKYEVSNFGRLRIKRSKKIILPDINGNYEIVVAFKEFDIKVEDIVDMFKPKTTKNKTKGKK